MKAKMEIGQMPACLYYTIMPFLTNVFVCVRYALGPAKEESWNI